MATAITKREFEGKVPDKDVGKKSGMLKALPGVEKYLKDIGKLKTPADFKNAKKALDAAQTALPKVKKLLGKKPSKDETNLLKDWTKELEETGKKLATAMKELGAAVAETVVMRALLKRVKNEELHFVYANAGKDSKLFLLKKSTQITAAKKDALKIGKVFWGTCKGKGSKLTFKFDPSKKPPEIRKPLRAILDKYGVKPIIGGESAEEEEEEG